MQKIKIFLASSNELKIDRDQFEIEIYRKCKAWFDSDIFLHLDIWEDLSARMSSGGSQSEYNKFVKEADLFVFLAYTKVGMYTAEEFEKAFGQFQSTEKPFIFTYFKTYDVPVDDSLDKFKEKLSELGHFYSPFKDNNDLWNQFNKELERLEINKFKKFEQEGSANSSEITGDKNINLQGVSDSEINIQGDTNNQTADKIHNIEKIDKADFS